MKAVTAVAIAIAAGALPIVSLAETPERATTLVDQRSVNLTIYNGDMALVHDRRRVPLVAGLNHIAWRDVTASMDSASAVVDSAQSSSRISVLEQNFDYDVLNQDSLLRAYVGKEVTIVHHPRFAGERERRERARILTVDDGIVLQYADRIETSLDGSIEFPGIPSSLRDRPTLALDIDSENAGAHDLDLRYLTSGLSWHVDYVGTLDPDSTHLSLMGLVTVQNTSGTSFHNARLQLVAGNLNLPAARTMLKTIARVSSASADTYATQENYFEYHLYTMPHPTTILDKQTKQLTLLEADGIPVKKTLELRGNGNYYQGEMADLGSRQPVGVYISFVNSGGQLGIPLPAGTVRVYEDDSRGLAQFLGGDNIGHTPRNDNVRLYLGQSFDVVANRQQTDYHLWSNCSSSSSYEIELINGKDTDQEVTVVEPIPGDWHITQESQSHTKSSASTATWLVHVPADSRATLTYTANVSWCRN